MAQDSFTLARLVLALLLLRNEEIGKETLCSLSPGLLICTPGILPGPLQLLCGLERAPVKTLPGSVPGT